MEVPATVRASLRDEPGGAAWLARLPELVEAACARLRVRVCGPPFAGGYVAWVAPVERARGGAAVLKLGFPDEETLHEPTALRLYDGNGAVRLLAEDAESGSLLLERLEPGTSLIGSRDALRVVAALAPRLHLPLAGDHPFPSGAALARAWAATLRGEAAAIAAELARWDGELVLVNRDLHLGNILAAQREPWLLIDPKPVASERAFDGGWLVYDLARRAPRTPAVVRRIVRDVAAALCVEHDRVRAWALVRAAAEDWHELESALLRT